MLNEKIYKKILLIKIKKSLEDFQGIKSFNVQDSIFDEYNNIQIIDLLQK